MLTISHDVFNERPGTVIGLAITTQPQRAGFPLTMNFPERTLRKISWVKISQIRTLSIERIGKKIGRVSPEQLNRALEGLMEILHD